MEEKEIRKSADEYINIPSVKAAIKCGNIEDLESHVKVAYENGCRYAISNQWQRIERDKDGFSQEVLGEVLIREKDDTVYINYDDDYVHNVNCTHYMKIPESPKESEELAKMFPRISQKIIEGGIVTVSDDGDSFVSEETAKEAVIAAVREERENAIKAFRKVHCRMGIEIPCNRCSSTCKIIEFRNLLNE